MASSPLPNYKYFDLIYGQIIRREALLNLRSPCLKPVASLFFKNLARTDSFTLFPAVAAYESVLEQYFIDLATFKAFGKIYRRKRKYSPKEQSRYNAELAKIYKAHNKRIKAGKEVSMDQKLRRGADKIQRLASYQLGSSQSLEALLFAVIVESWMSFETLVSDLFYTALDKGPSEWRINVGKKHKEFTGGSDFEPTKVAPAIAADPQEGYGSFLRDHDMISFQKFRAIKFWYRIAFGNACEKLFYKTEGGYIRALSAARNVILHKAGIADATYKKEIVKFPELNSVEEKKTIELDGKIVRKLRNAGIALAIELLKYVDDAITPPKP